MQKTILVTGATDGIGLETAKLLVAQGHRVLLHGRNPTKLSNVKKELETLPGAGPLENYVADLSRMDDVMSLAKSVAEKHQTLDVLINNAGVFKTGNSLTADNLDVRFAVNTLAPYLLTKQLLPQLGTAGRVVNLSSAAQTPVEIEALKGKIQIADDFTAYAQSKLAITMWTRTMAQSRNGNGPVIVAVNPGSLLASKMVKEGFGVAGNDLRIGAKVLVHASLDETFAAASGQYFDNDSGQFASPHTDALDQKKCAEATEAIEAVLARIVPNH